ncbi:MAG: M15 family metallopeptidase [Saprospiraceae bacterium]
MQYITRFFPAVILALLISFIFLLCKSPRSNNILPDQFKSIQSEIPNIVMDIKYYTHDNFMGRPINGYQKPVAILSKKALFSLVNVQNELNLIGFGLKIFDAYRPQRAVNNFIEWAADLTDTIMKKQYYPDVKKSDLFDQGYIAARSGHSRGSTLDLTIIHLKSEQELDMGGVYDFFGRKSHHNYTNLTNKQKRNREYLKSTMEKHGFKAYSKEWWHYTLKDEPFPETYFDFPVN